MRKLVEVDCQLVRRMLEFEPRLCDPRAGASSLPLYYFHHISPRDCEGEEALVCRSSMGSQSRSQLSD